MKMYLKNARLSLGGDNKLMVVLEDGLASDYFKEKPTSRISSSWRLYCPTFPARRSK